MSLDFYQNRCPEDAHYIRKDNEGEYQAFHTDDLPCPEVEFRVLEDE